MAAAWKVWPVLLLALVVAAAPGSVSRPARAAEEPPEIGPEVQAVIQRGLAYLVQRQRKDGAFRGSWAGRDEQRPLPVSALAGLALLASGSTALSGPYAENIRDAVDYVLRCRSRTGLLIHGHDSQHMYGHGFATLFLAECYGTGLDPEREAAVRDALRGAVALIQQSQSQAGGWYYHANANDDEGSVTITQIQALRAARNAGIKVDRRTIERAIDYVRRSQEPDGGVRYTVRYGRSTLALTAAGLAVFYGAGDYDSDGARRALAYVRARMKVDATDHAYFHYTHFYAGQALFQQGGADWASYFPKVRAALLREACDDRVRHCFWRSAQFGDTYATSMALLVLQIPYRYLPIYER